MTVDKQNLIEKAKHLQGWYSYQQKLKSYYHNGDYQSDFESETEVMNTFIKSYFTEICEKNLSGLSPQLIASDPSNVLLTIGEHVYRFHFSENEGFYTLVFFINADPPQRVFTYKLTRNQAWELLWVNKEHEDANEYCTSEALVLACIDFILHNVEHNLLEQRV